jgi:hypothetical protein
MDQLQQVNLQLSKQVEQKAVENSRLESDLEQSMAIIEEKFASTQFL